MTMPENFERTVAIWLRTEAERPIPDQLQALLARTTDTRQRQWWSSPGRWLPMDTTLTGRLAPAMRPAWPLIILVLLVALAAAVLLVGARQRLPAPYGPAVNGSILYSAKGDIHIAAPNGQDVRVLVGGDAIDHAPLPSNDGTKFIFWRVVGPDRFQPMVADIDGRDVRDLVPTIIEEPTWAAWSPDGSEILLVHVEEGRQIVSIVPVDGGGSMRRMPLEGLVPAAPMWRPDGREIFFQGVARDRVSLYLANADGTAVRQIAPIKGDLGFYIAPRLSPDGTRVTFWHNQFVDIARYPEGRKSEVHVLDLNSGDEIRIGYDPTSRHELHPRFSPDGQSILFVRFGGNPDMASLHIAAVDGSDGVGRQIGPRQVWAPSGVLEEPIIEFSPDGTKVILSFGEESRGQIIDVATGAVEESDYADFVAWQRTGGTGLGDLLAADVATPCPGGGCR
jgi:Tol biopolymer transport system component